METLIRRSMSWSGTMLIYEYLRNRDLVVSTELRLRWS